MKRFISMAFIFVVMFSSNIFFTACSCSCNAESFRIGDVLDEATIDMTGVKGFAMVEETIPSANAVSSGNHIRDKKDKDKKPNIHLGVVKENDELIVPDIKDATNAIVNQKALGLEVYKLHVEKDFTYVSFISSKIRKTSEVTIGPSYNSIIPIAYFEDINFSYLLNVPIISHHYNNYKNDRHDNHSIQDITYGVCEDFNNTLFMYNDYVKSYIIDNSTGKMYSTKDIPTFDVYNGVIHDYGEAGANGYATVYDMSVVNGDLVLEDMVPNKDVVVYNATKDKYGYYYVYNNTLDSKIDNIVYIKTDNNTNNSFRIDEEVYFYNSSEEKYYKYVNGVAVEYTGDIALKKDIVYSGNNGTKYLSSSFKKGQYSIGINGVYDSVGQSSYDYYVEDVRVNYNSYDSSCYATWLDENTMIYLGENSKLYSLTFDWDSISVGGNRVTNIGVTLLKDGGVTHTNKLVKIGNIYQHTDVYSVTTPTTTEEYVVERGSDGVVGLRLIRDMAYTGSVITIQPIN